MFQVGEPLGALYHLKWFPSMVTFGQIQYICEAMYVSCLTPVALAHCTSAYDLTPWVKPNPIHPCNHMHVPMPMSMFISPQDPPPSPPLHHAHVMSPPWLHTYHLPWFSPSYRIFALVTPLLPLLIFISVLFSFGGESLAHDHFVFTAKRLGMVEQWSQHHHHHHHHVFQCVKEFIIYSFAKYMNTKSLVTLHKEGAFVLFLVGRLTPKLSTIFSVWDILHRRTWEHFFQHNFTLC